MRSNKERKRRKKTSFQGMLDGRKGSSNSLIIRDLSVFEGNIEIDPDDDFFKKKIMCVS